MLKPSSSADMVRLILTRGALARLHQILEVDRELGPIEADLRQAGVRWWTLERKDAFDVWCGATESLGLRRADWGTDGGDISSEAIEHAEYLGI